MNKAARQAGRRRSVTNPLLDAKRDEAAYQIEP